MKNIRGGLLPWIISCAFFGAMRLPAGDLPAYRLLTPMVTIHATSLADALQLLNDGLAGAGVEIQSSGCGKTLADLCFLPSFDGVDLRSPIRYFLLSLNPPTAMPEQAVILPLQSGGSSIVLRNLRERYASVEGGSIKICSNPVDGKSVEPLYVAMAEGNAMISPDVDAIRWMAYNLQSKTVPEPPNFRNAPLSASADGKSLGLLLELIASLDAGDDTGEKTAGKNIFQHIRELGVFFSAFQGVEIAIDASISQWNAAVRLVAEPGSERAEAIAALKPPDDTWMELFPAYACNRSASCLSGFVATLPASNRKWLADLATNTRLVGFSVIPSAFDLDEKIRPFLTGTALSAFVTDTPNHKFGSVTIRTLKSPDLALKTLRGYFAPKGAASANKQISDVVPQGRNGVISYEIVTDGDSRQKGGVSGTSEAVSLMLNLDYVQLAVHGNRMIIARGAAGLIDPWLMDTRPAPWNERVSSLTAGFPGQPGETVLGGGSLEPVTLARSIAGAIRDFNQHFSKLPHPGSGFAWRMARKGGEARFDLRLYSNEIIACNRLRAVNSETTKQILAQLVLRHFQLSSESETQRARLRERLNDFREK